MYYRFWILTLQWVIRSTWYHYARQTLAEPATVFLSNRPTRWPPPEKKDVKPNKVAISWCIEKNYTLLSRYTFCKEWKISEIDSRCLIIQLLWYFEIWKKTLEFGTSKRSKIIFLVTPLTSGNTHSCKKITKGTKKKTHRAKQVLRE